MPNHRTRALQNGNGHRFFAMPTNGDHEIQTVFPGGNRTPVNDNCITVRLAPGAGARLVMRMERYAYQPTLSFPWDRF